MKISGILVALAAALFVVPPAAPALGPEWLQGAPPPARAAQASQPDGTGFTLRSLFDRKLLIVVKPPLPLDVVNQLAGGPHRPGPPPELLTPGDTGVTVRLRW